MVGAAAVLLVGLRATSWPLLAALVAGLLYVDGHGIHLAANSIAREELMGEAERVAHFWDEQFGHIEWHLGWFGLVASFCFAEAVRPARPVTTAAGGRLADAASVGLLGFTLFTNTVEGGTWWLELGAAVVLSVWAARARRPLVAASALAFLFGAVLIGIWAAWHGGVPQFSEVGWI